MGTHRAHIVLPDDLAAEIDALVGPRGRSAFLVETAREALRRRRLLAFIEQQRIDPVWKDKDHPELKNGSRAWIKELRKGSEKRLARLEEARRSPK